MRFDAMTLDDMLRMQIENHKRELLKKGSTPEDWAWIEQDYAGDLSSQAYILGALAKDD